MVTKMATVDNMGTHYDAKHGEMVENWFLGMKAKGNNYFEGVAIALGLGPGGADQVRSSPAGKKYARFLSNLATAKEKYADRTSGKGALLVSRYKRAFGM